jgi:peptidoglycan/LPS O-acetylase OafA/YrhL
MQNKRIVWSKDVTNIIKGIAILMIVLGHAGNRIPGARVLTPLGAVGVGLFLICSGYGLEKSYIKNGLSKYWTKKLYGIYMPWVLIEVIGFFFHPQVGGGQFVSLLAIACATIIFWDGLYAQNSLSFLTGVVLSKKECYLDRLTRKSSICILVLALIPLAYIRMARLLVVDDCNPIVWNIYSLAYYYSFTLVILSLILHIVEMNTVKYLSVIGVYSYSIYLVHGYTFEYFNSSSIVGIASFFMATFVGSIVFQKISDFTKYILF